MSRSMEQFQELAELLELQLEERISADQFRRLELLIRENAEARRFYREYVDLHGMLYWDAANASEARLLDAPDSAIGSSRCRPDSAGQATRLATGKRRRAVLAVSVCTLVAVLAIPAYLKNAGVDPAGSELVDHPVSEIELSPDAASPDGAVIAKSDDSADASVPELVRLPAPSTDVTDSRPVNPQTPDGVHSDAVNAVSETAVAVNAVPDSANKAVGDSRGAVVAFINQQLASRWDESGIEPSLRADDAEWLRRVSLDIVGHIPSPTQAREFLVDRNPNKRAAIVDALLDDEDYILNWTTVWANRLIGRSNPREVNRPALEKFLRETFAQNEGWDRTVYEFVSAQGSNRENGATNFLLAHVNNQAVPATAITARLFLGLQLQCTQCHSHPFNEKTQDEFWSFNSCFEQIKKTRQMTSPADEVFLVDEPRGGPTLYETRNGLIRVALPRYDGKAIATEESVNRREELARLMTTGESTQVARAFVNRMWHDFFGAGFTTSVDDMGPHVGVSHPELLDRLSREFVSSGYDIKQLIRWICNSEAYNLTSQSNETNLADNPEIGSEPLFSRVYVKQMTVEQLFDSLLIATQAREVFGSDWETVEKRRQQWLQQFVVAWGTDENDEADLFSGTISQALMMMNGELVQLALDSGKGAYLDRVLRSSDSENDKIEAITLATLSRSPSRTEAAAVRKLMRDSVAHRPRGTEPSVAVRSSLQDLFWACLNSNEFILIH